MNPACAAPPLDDPRLLRYSRHLLLDEIGVSGQEALLAAHALIIGAGGLGSPVALYLAASGVGRITLADDDRVDLSNLQRQIAHTQDSIGTHKAESAARRMRAMNPDVTVVPLNARLQDAALFDAVAHADIVLDCSDNFATRHAVNRACVQHQKPLVSGAAVRFDGQVSVFDLRDARAPCYACLFPDTGQTDEMQCATFGVLSPLVGVIGAMQAIEALKLLTGAGRSLSGRLQLFNALEAEWREMRFSRDPDCPVCGSESA